MRTTPPTLCLATGFPLRGEPGCFRPGEMEKSLKFPRPPNQGHHRPGHIVATDLARLVELTGRLLVEQLSPRTYSD